MGSIHILGYQKYFLLFLCKQPLSWLLVFLPYSEKCKESSMGYGKQQAWGWDVRQSMLRFEAKSEQEFRYNTNEIFNCFWTHWLEPSS